MIKAVAASVSVSARLFLSSILVLTLFATLPTLAFSQAQPQSAARADLIAKVCRSTEVTSGPAFDELQRIKTKLAPVLSRDTHHRIAIFLTTSDEINAWTRRMNMNDSLICIPVAMARFMADGEGELAFTVAHEIGHAVDDACKTASGRAAIAQQANPGGSFLAGLIGGQRGTAVMQQRNCEARADEIGFNVFTAAGYNPFDAAGAFGRLEMYYGDTSTGLLARMNAMGQDHPMTADRIKHMRTVLLQRGIQ